MRTSGQLAIRLTLLVLVALVVLASEFGLDVILGAFAAGVIVGFVIQGRRLHEFEGKLDAVGYGFLIPIFFIATGMEYDLDALLDSPSAMALVPGFALLFLVTRGLPAWLLYRGELDLARARLARPSSRPPPAPDRRDHRDRHRHGVMRTEEAVALVGAGMLSVLVYPLMAADPAQARRGGPARSVRRLSSRRPQALERAGGLALARRRREQTARHLAEGASGKRELVAVLEPGPVVLGLEPVADLRGGPGRAVADPAGDAGRVGLDHLPLDLERLAGKAELLLERIALGERARSRRGDRVVRRHPAAEQGRVHHRLPDPLRRDRDEDRLGDRTAHETVSARSAVSIASASTTSSGRCLTVNSSAPLGSVTTVGVLSPRLICAATSGVPGVTAAAAAATVAG